MVFSHKFPSACNTKLGDSGHHELRPQQLAWAGSSYLNNSIKTNAYVAADLIRR
jgi:hypothetical protein